MSDVSQLVRPLLGQLHAYVPGEQPKIAGLIKLNTNENPNPPSPKVLKAIRSATDARLRLYPNPTADRLREKLAAHHKCKPENVIVGNGSDELLALATRVFVEPAGNVAPSRSTIQYFTPSYSLYPVLADIHGAVKNGVPLRADFTLPSVEELRRGGQWNFDAALTYLTTPNAPSGRGYATAELEDLCRAHRGVAVLDEAYVDFAGEHAMPLAFKYPHVIVARTFSKGYSLCFLRVGYFVGHPELIAALHKVRDSYNVNGIGQIAAEATLNNVAYYRKNFRRIIATRKRVSDALSKLGFEVLPSQTNFIFVRPPLFSARDWLEKLRAEKILVRWWDYPNVRDYLRVTIGTDNEMKTLLQVAKRIISTREKARR
ncbi:MAG TPA: histidinol-phosphate transaminase [Candidatus Binatia bacterium]|nr:histidinol-phosphate transaminase [Candidatus Binatia bacterium]